MKRNEFVEYVIGDQLAELPDMSARAMFSGYGIYKDGIIVGIVIDDELYLKADETTKPEYEAMGSEPFTYERKDGKSVVMSYYKVPSDILENRSELVRLVELSYDINLEKAVDKGRRKKK